MNKQAANFGSLLNFLQRENDGIAVWFKKLRHKNPACLHSQGGAEKDLKKPGFSIQNYCCSPMQDRVMRICPE